MARKINQNKVVVIAIGVILLLAGLLFFLQNNSPTGKAYGDICTTTADCGGEGVCQNGICLPDLLTNNLLMRYSFSSVQGNCIQTDAQGDCLQRQAISVLADMQHPLVDGLDQPILDNVIALSEARLDARLRDVTCISVSDRLLGQFCHFDANSIMEYDGERNLNDLGVDNIFDLPTSWTISLWVRPEAQSRFQGLFAGGRSRPGGNRGLFDDYTYLVALTDSNRIGFYGRDGVWRESTQVIPQQWTHIAVSHDGQQVQFYINGQPAGTVPDSGGSSVPASRFVIRVGGYNDLAVDGLLVNNYFEGLLDEMRFYNRVLPEEEIRTALFSPYQFTEAACGNDQIETGEECEPNLNPVEACMGGTWEGLRTCSSQTCVWSSCEIQQVLHYQMNTGSFAATSVSDRSGNNNQGTVNGEGLFYQYAGVVPVTAPNNEGAYALRLDGNDFITYDLQAEQNQEYTISFWFSVDSVEGEEGLFQWARQNFAQGDPFPYLLAKRVGDEVHFYVCDNNNNCNYHRKATGIVANRWYFVAINKINDGTQNNFVFYLGDPAASGQRLNFVNNDIDLNLLPPANIPVIGDATRYRNGERLFFGTGHGGPMSGMIDEIQVYRQGLSGEAIGYLGPETLIGGILYGLRPVQACTTENLQFCHPGNCRLMGGVFGSNGCVLCDHDDQNTWNDCPIGCPDDYEDYERDCRQLTCSSNNRCVLPSGEQIGPIYEYSLNTAPTQTQLGSFRITGETSTADGDALLFAEQNLFRAGEGLAREGGFYFDGSSVAPVDSNTGMTGDFILRNWDAARDSFTISFWVMPDSLEGEEGLFQWAAHDGYPVKARFATHSAPAYMIKRVGSEIRFWLPHPQISEANNYPEQLRVMSGLTTERYHHLALKKQGNIFTTYFDGQRIGEVSLDNLNVNLINNGQVLFFGTGHGGQFNGRMDEIQVYARALADNEVLSHFQSNPTRSLPCSPTSLDLCRDEQNCLLAGRGIWAANTCSSCLTQQRFNAFKDEFKQGILTRTSLIDYNNIKYEFENNIGSTRCQE